MAHNWSSLHSHFTDLNKKVLKLNFLILKRINLYLKNNKKKIDVASYP